MGRQTGRSIPEVVCRQAFQPQGGGPADEGQRPDGPAQHGLRARREPKKRKPVTDTPDTGWGTDMAKTRTAQGWAKVHVVLDWGSRKLLALAASPTIRSSDWIQAIEKAEDMQFPDGIDLSGRIC